VLALHDGVVQEVPRDREAVGRAMLGVTSHAVATEPAAAGVADTIGGVA
jgi:hypothetical protein